MSFKHLALCVGACALLTGCTSTTFENTVKSTKQFYGDYINTPAQIDYEDKGDLSQAERELARRMMGMETQLIALERVLDNADRPPTGDSVGAIMNRFPWLAGIALLDAEGQVMEHQPPSLKSLNFTPFLERTGRDKSTRTLRGLVQDTPLGPETMLGMPIYRDAEMLGLLVVHFDMRSLLPFASEPGEMVILSPEGVLWPGKFVISSTPLAGQDWRSLTASNVMGTVSNANGEFVWLVRYVGSEPVVFAVPSRGNFPEDPEQLNLLGYQSPQGMVAPVHEYDRTSGQPSSFLDSPAPRLPQNPGVNISPIRQ